VYLDSVRFQTYRTIPFFVLWFWKAANVIIIFLFRCLNVVVIMVTGQINPGEPCAWSLGAVRGRRGEGVMTSKT